MSYSMDRYFTSRVHCMVQFYGRVQDVNETNEEYIHALYSLAQKCEFSTNLDDNIKCGLLAGMRDKTLSKQLQRLQEKDLTLDSITSVMRAQDIREKHFYVPVKRLVKPAVALLQNSRPVGCAGMAINTANIINNNHSRPPSQKRKVFPPSGKVCNKDSNVNRVS